MVGTQTPSGVSMAHTFAPERSFPPESGRGGATLDTITKVMP